MADVAGLVVGGVGLAALFDSVVNCFERIHVGKEYKETYERHLLQLDVLRLRLTRWHNAVAKLIEVGDTGVQDANGQLLKSHLLDIENLFQKEEKLSKYYNSSTSGSETLSSVRETDSHWLMRALRRLSRKRLVSTSEQETRPPIRHQLRWAIRGKTEFEQLVRNVTVQVSNLEKILETNELERRLNQLRVEDAGEIGKQPEANKKDLQLLQEIATDVDQKFAELVKVRMGHEFIGNTAEGEARLNQGDIFSSDYRGGVTGAGHIYWNNSAKDKARVTQGNIYGYNPFI